MNQEFKNRMVSSLSRALWWAEGKKEFHFLFRTLYYLSLSGLNYGKVHSLETDGELFQIKQLKALLKDREVTIFDVGANEGQYSRLVLNVFGRNKINLHLFEPSADTFDRLTTNLKGEGIALNNFGLSDKNERLTLYKSGSGSDYASVYLSERSDHTETIELKTLDDYCNEHDVDNIDFLKIDVEGHEFKCLQGAEKMLKDGKIRFIQFEFGVSKIYSRVFFRDIFDFLTSRGYVIGRVLKNGLAPIRTYHPNLEVYLTTNYVAQYKSTQ